MAQTQKVARFACPSCQKEFTWKPEIAGKKARCKCGNILDVPAAPPPPPLPPPGVDPFDNPDYMYDFADEPARPGPKSAAAPALPIHIDLQLCPHCGGNITPANTVCLACGYDTRTRRMHKPAPRKGAAGAVLPYQRKGLTDESEERHIDGWIVKDLYIPIGLIGVGTALSYVNAMYVAGIGSFAFASVWVGVTTLVNLVLIFIGMLIGVQLLSLSLGSPATAAIKITAIAMVPAPIANLIAYHIGPGGDYIGWSISMLFYYGMFMYFFDMDFQETMICSAIIWIIRTWIGWLLIALLFSGFMSRLGGTGNTLGGFGAGPDDDDIPAIVNDASDDVDDPTPDPDLEEDEEDLAE